MAGIYANRYINIGGTSMEQQNSDFDDHIIEYENHMTSNFERVHIKMREYCCSKCGYNDKNFTWCYNTGCICHKLPHRVTRYHKEMQMARHHIRI